jgi:hypothetical protein
MMNERHALTEFNISRTLRFKNDVERRQITIFFPFDVLLQKKVYNTKLVFNADVRFKCH